MKDCFLVEVNILEEVENLSKLLIWRWVGTKDEEDIEKLTNFIGGDIVNTFYDYGSVTFNSVYTQENFDLTQEFNYTLSLLWI